MKIGVMFGSPETTTGGNALKFYASVRLDIRRVGAIKEASTTGKDPAVVGNRTRVKVVKNKLAPPFREVEFDILYGQGISRSGDAVDLGVEAGIVEKSGSWFSYQGERIGQGRENARTFLEQNAAIMQKIEGQVLEKHGILRKLTKDEVASASASAKSPADAKAAPADAKAAPATPKAAPPPAKDADRRDAKPAPKTN
jgi:recombination protein RecA